MLTNDGEVLLIEGHALLNVRLERSERSRLIK